VPSLSVVFSSKVSFCLSSKTAAPTARDSTSRPRPALSCLEDSPHTPSDAGTRHGRAILPPCCRVSPTAARAGRKKNCAAAGCLPPARPHASTAHILRPTHHVLSTHTQLFALPTRNQNTKPMSASLASCSGLAPARRSGAPAGARRGAAQVARVVPNKKALSYDESWKKVCAWECVGGVRRVSRRGEGDDRNRSPSCAAPTRPLSRAAPCPLSYPPPHHPPLTSPFLCRTSKTTKQGFWGTGYFLEGKETRGTNYLAVRLVLTDTLM
jgi:hypothetical protein